MLTVREIAVGQTHLAVPVLRELRPSFATDADLTEQIDVRQRPVGYRLVGAFEEPGGSAISVAGFRVLENLAWGRFLYVDDLGTVTAARRGGAAQMLMVWLQQEARRSGCAQLHLDSGVCVDRAAAHALYFRSGLRISSHHFSVELQ